MSHQQKSSLQQVTLPFWRMPSQSAFVTQWVREMSNWCQTDPLAQLEGPGAGTGRGTEGTTTGAGTGTGPTLMGVPTVGPETGAVLRSPQESKGRVKLEQMHANVVNNFGKLEIREAIHR
jgi:hypothetical protein